MFELLISVSRYLFLFYMLFFLYNGLRFITSERKRQDGARYIRRQRYTIIALVLTAYMIIIYDMYLTPYMAGNGLVFTYTDAVQNGAAVVLFMIFGFASSGIFYKKGNPLLWNGIFFLLAIGLVTLQRLNHILVVKQIIWCFLGYITALIAAFVLKLASSVLEKIKYVYLISGILILFLPFVFGERQGGAFNWVNINGIGFQPSELVKVLFVFYLAAALRNPPTNKQLLKTALTSAVFVICLAVQTDLGGALIFFMTFMIIIYISTSKEYLFFLGMLLMSAASFIAYALFGHVRTRVAIWQDPWYDPTNDGYQLIQSLYAICAGGLFGCGLTRGLPQKIPVVERDFIFSAICEEFGVLFASGVILVFVMFFYKGFQIAARCRSSFYSLIAAGFTGMLAFQAFLIIGGSIKLIPLTGVTLLFMSYGGSSIMISLLIVGILQRIHYLNETDRNDVDEVYEDA